MGGDLVLNAGLCVPLAFDVDEVPPVDPNAIDPNGEHEEETAEKEEEHPLCDGRKPIV